MTTFSFQNFNRNKIPSPLGYNTMLDYPLENQNYITNFSSPKKSSKTSIDNSKQITPALSEKNKYNENKKEQLNRIFDKIPKETREEIIQSSISNDDRTTKEYGKDM